MYSSIRFALKQLTKVELRYHFSVYEPIFGVKYSVTFSLPNHQCQKIGTLVQQ